MVERVAKELEAIEFELPGAGGLRGTLNLAPAYARQIAEAVMVAMRTPTDSMIEAGDDAMDWDSSDTNGSYFVHYHDGDAAKSWEAMIDTALTPTKCGDSQ